jgi:Sigma-70, region 4
VATFSNPTGYLFRVAQSSARRGRTPAVLVAPETADSGYELQLAKALGPCPDRQRLAVMLVHRFGWRAAEVAALIGVRPTSVQNHLERGLRRLAGPLELMKMANDLATQIRELIDRAAPMTMDEAIARSSEIPTVGGVRIPPPPDPPDRGLRRGASDPRRRRRGRGAAHDGPTRDVRGGAFDPSGGAHRGAAAPHRHESVGVTFDGANIDERITVFPVPAGSARTFTTDDRLVDGQFCIYTSGPGDVLEWMHVPDPRSLYGALDASAEFEALGSTTLGGTTVTHLEALDPTTIPTAPLGDLADGSLVSFSMWVDSNDVVNGSLSPPRPLPAAVCSS